jgi:hypothetical protein
MSAQKLQVAGDRRRNHLAAWHLGPNKLVQLGKSFSESVAPIPGTTLAYLEEWKEYAMDRSIGRRAADLYLVDMLTGDRTKLKDKVDDAFAQLSPAGKYVLFLQDDQFWTIDLKTKAVTNLTKAVPAVFIEKESDATVKQKPSFGIAGWTKDDTAVLINDKFDVWQVPVDGSKATRLTNGATEEIRHRITRVSTDEDFIDVSKPQFVACSVSGRRSPAMAPWPTARSRACSSRTRRWARSRKPRRPTPTATSCRITTTRLTFSSPAAPA